MQFAKMLHLLSVLRGGDGEVFEFVVDEIDFIGLAQGRDVFKHLRQRLLLVGARDGLRVLRDCYRASKQQSDDNSCHKVHLFRVVDGDSLVVARDANVLKVVEELHVAL